MIKIRCSVPHAVGVLLLKSDYLLNSAEERKNSYREHKKSNCLYIGHLIVFRVRDLYLKNESDVACKEQAVKNRRILKLWK